MMNCLITSSAPVAVIIDSYGILIPTMYFLTDSAPSIRSNLDKSKDDSASGNSIKSPVNDCGEKNPPPAETLTVISIRSCNLSPLLLRLPSTPPVKFEMKNGLVQSRVVKPPLLTLQS